MTHPALERAIDRSRELATELMNDAHWGEEPEADTRSDLRKFLDEVSKEDFGHDFGNIVCPEASDLDDMYTLIEQWERYEGAPRDLMARLIGEMIIEHCERYAA